MSHVTSTLSKSIDCQPAIEPRALNTANAANYIGHSMHFLKKARRGLTNVAGPNFRRIGNRVIYLREDLDAWLEMFKPMASISQDSAQPLNESGNPA